MKRIQSTDREFRIKHKLLTASEPMVRGQFYTATNGLLTKTAATGVPTDIGAYDKDAQTIVAKEAFFPIEDRELVVPITDVEGDCFYVAATGGASDGTTLIDTVNRTEADNYWDNTLLYRHKTGEYLNVTDSVSSTKTLTLTPAASSQIVAGEYYSITRLVNGASAVTLHTDAKSLTNETVSGGAMQIKGRAILSEVGNERVACRGTSEA